MDKNNNWQDISDDISDLSKKIKANLTEEELVGDLKDSLNSTIEASGEILKNITNAVQETVKDEEIKSETRSVLEKINNELKNVVNQISNKIGMDIDGISTKEEE
tara:strand:+ start:176 stop:490 length:315 start_codon:yes stop_codon:yes gene_type:complete